MLALWIRGYNDSEIATRMSLDGQTIETCFRDLQRKLGVSDRLDLVLHVLAGNSEVQPPLKHRAVLPAA
jgi:DNA-binding NarL/FixJ family response regulator